MSSNFKHLDLKLLISAIIVGLFSGTIVVFYRFLLGLIEGLLLEISDIVETEPLILVIYIMIIIVVGLLLNYFIKKERLISGSGIPQIEAELGKMIDSDPLKVLIYKFFGGILSSLGGLSLGREGPSIQLGAMAAKLLGKRFKLLDDELLLMSGSAAGLSGAFSAPLSGVMFCLEELHHSFSTKVLITVMAASVSADFIASYVFGFTPTFSFVLKDNISLIYYPLIILLGILIGMLGVFYNNGTLFFQKLLAKVSTESRIYIPLVLSIILLRVMPEVLGGGHHLLEFIDPSTSLSLLIVLLTVKFFFSFISFGSGAPGGIFFPLLVEGSLFGAIFALIMIKAGLLDEAFFFHFVILAMAAFFTAIVRAPITGIILIFEMTGSLANLLPLLLCSISSYIVAEYFKCPPIYESLLEKYEPEELRSLKDVELLEMTVEYQSLVSDKKVAEINWPKEARIIKIERYGKSFIADGHTIIHSGDRLSFHITTRDQFKVKNELLALLQSK